MQNSQMITIHNLNKRYANSQYLALNNVELSINKGDFFGLLGPNGSGKTTLISILCGLIKPSSGSVIIAEQPIPQKISHLKHLINLVPQEIALYPTLTLRENIIFFAKMYGLQSDILNQRLHESLTLSGLKHFADLPIETFSGGMQRRANLIVSLINQPQILFLDEPAAHVDPQSRELIFGILKKLNTQGVTIIYTTHYLEEAEKLCSKVAIMDNGHILCHGTPAQLINTYHTTDISSVFFILTGKELRDQQL